MKAVFISYNQALTDRLAYMFDQLQIKGYTKFPLVYGQGTHFGEEVEGVKEGEPRMGTHAWPEMNSAVLTIVEDHKVPLILKYVSNLDHVNLQNGIRAFVWNIEQTY